VSEPGPSSERPGERLQKILARAGFGSRRSAEQLIFDGRVRLNGAVVTELGTRADPSADRIEVDGEPILLPEEHLYVVLHKPSGFVTTSRDPQGRRTVIDLLPPALRGRIYPVGRLDRDTEGLLVFTNDGVLAHRLAHPRYEIEKEYHALVRGVPSVRALQALRRGVDIDGVRTSPAQADAAPPPYGYDAAEGSAWLCIVVHEGRKRQVRRMCEAVGHPVRRLVRTRLGDVLLGRLARGKTRALTPQELASLRAAVNLVA
jgi:23S rRNA pseudouridine2605 synthase